VKLIKNFAIVVVSLIGDLWLGLGIKSKIYDDHTTMKTKPGYFIFITVAALLALSIVVLLAARIY
jgi:hypothetical protein